MRIVHNIIFYSIIKNLRNCVGDEFLDGINRSVFGFVLDDGSIGLDNIDSGEGFCVQVSGGEFTFFVSTEFVNIDVRSFGEFLEFFFHSLAKLAPWGVDGNDRSLSGLSDFQSGVGGFDVLDST